MVHQDLKPQNIMRNQLGGLVLIDFGLASVYQLPQNRNLGLNIIKNKKRGFVGTPRYASLASHNGCPQLPKDDI